MKKLEMKLFLGIIIFTFQLLRCSANLCDSSSKQKYYQIIIKNKKQKKLPFQQIIKLINLENVNRFFSSKNCRKFFSKEISDQKSNKIYYDNKLFMYWPTGPTNNSVYTRQRFIGTNLTIWKLTKSAANEDICAIHCSISFWKSEV